MSAALPSAIAVPQECFDKLKGDVRRGRHTATRPFKITFTGDSFSTSVWLDGQKLMARDPEHGVREIVVTDPTKLDLNNGDTKFGNFKGLVISALATLSPDNYAEWLPAVQEFKPKLLEIQEKVDAAVAFKEWSDNADMKRFVLSILLAAQTELAIVALAIAKVFIKDFTKAKAAELTTHIMRGFWKLLTADE